MAEQNSRLRICKYMNKCNKPQCPHGVRHNEYTAYCDRACQYSGKPCEEIRRTKVEFKFKV